MVQGRNCRENLDATSAMVGRICPPPPGEDRVKISENLGATSVAPVAPVDTSLHFNHMAMKLRQIVIELTSTR